MKKRQQILDKLVELIELVDTDPNSLEQVLEDILKKEEKKPLVGLSGMRLENIAKKNPYDFKPPEITAVYKMNVATEKMVPVGQVTSQVEEDEFTIELFPDPEKNFKSYITIKQAQPYYPDWFIKHPKGDIKVDKEKYKQIFIVNSTNEIWLSTPAFYPVGFLTDNLKVSLYSSHEKFFNYNKGEVRISKR